MNDKANRRPLIDPLLLVLKSRRVIVALAALLTGLLIIQVPTLQPVQDEVLVLIITLALAVIGGFSVEDAALAAREDAPGITPDLDDLHDLLWDVVERILDALNDTEQR
ncbi:MAG: hypothetical protein OHK0046_16500 [Anaerolineae bacterium]